MRQKTNRKIPLPIIILILLSCNVKENSNVEQQTLNGTFFYFGKRHCDCCRDLLYELNFNNHAIDGHSILLGKYLDEVDSLKIKGIAGKKRIEWTTFLRNSSTSREFFSLGEIDSLGGISIWRYHENDSSKMDSVSLELIDKKTYLKKIAEALAEPELITLKSDTIIGKYLFEIEVKNWNEKTNYGNTTFIIKDRITKKVIQTIKSDNFWFNPELYFGYDTDYNFDGITDLDFFNGFNGGYGTPTCDYYLYNKDLGQFVHNQELADLGRCMGIKVDSVKKRILSYAKSGCCWHQLEAYAAKGDDFDLIKSFVHDEFTDESVTIKEKINGKWKTRRWSENEITKKLIEDLYKKF